MKTTSRGDDFVKLLQKGEKNKELDLFGLYHKKIFHQERGRDDI